MNHPSSPNLVLNNSIQLYIYTHRKNRKEAELLISKPTSIKAAVHWVLPTVRVTMNMKILLLVAFYFHLSKCQQDLSQAAVPTFELSDYFPTRPSLNVRQTEADVCRPITDRIDLNSPRFKNELVTNNNGRITFQTANSHLMTSRMQSRLDTLEALYHTHNRRITILKAWTPFPDPQLPNYANSLHYEGKRMIWAYDVIN